MLSKFSHWSITRQLSTLVAIIVFIVSSITVIFVSQFSSRAEIEETKKQLKLELETVTNLLDLYYVSVEDKVTKLTKIFFLSVGKNFEIDTNQRIKIGQEELPALKAQDIVLNSNFEKLDQFKQNTEGEFTLFLKHNDDFIRISTTVLDSKGERALGQRLDKTGDAYKALMQGQSYTGRVKYMKKNYMAHYEPLKNSKGEVVGAALAGFSYDKALNDLREYLQKTVIGESGYFFIVDSKAHPSMYGELVLHPKYGQVFLKDLPNQQSKDIIENLLKHKTGYSSYSWPDKNGVEKEKIVYYQYINKWEWIIGGGSYTEEFGKESKKLRNLVIFILAIGGINTIIVLYYMMGRRLKPLKVIADAVNHLGQGDLTIRLDKHANDVNTHNEIYQLCYKLQHTIDNFRQLIQHILKSCQDLNQSIHNLTNVSNIVLHNSEDQSDATSSTSASIEEMTQSITNVAEHAQNAQSVSNEAQLKASQGQSIIDKVAYEISHMSQTIDSSAQIVIQLGEKSNNISAIVNVIREIAEQTNLLALNAAIEAARAGESGKGFAVVADEVRKLAERTANATGDITKMISDIQNETKHAVDQMQKVNEQVRQGSELTSQAGHAIGEITQSSLQALHAVQDIAHATQEQSHASQNISTQVEKIASMVSDTTISIQDSNQATKNLQNLADQLNQMVNRFKI